VIIVSGYRDARLERYLCSAGVFHLLGTRIAALRALVLEIADKSRMKRHLHVRI
jgi:hypothetical protein